MTTTKLTIEIRSYTQQSGWYTSKTMSVGPMNLIRAMREAAEDARACRRVSSGGSAAVFVGDLHVMDQPDYSLAWARGIIADAKAQQAGNVA